MTKYEVFTSKKFNKSYKKLSPQDKILVKQIIARLANDEILEPKYKDHSLTGKLKGYRDCHVKPDLVLIYEKDKDILLLTAINIGSHSDLFE